jgi:non-ribosomal peptide synthetase component F
VNTVFDVSIFNIFATLTSGGCLIQQEEILDFVGSKSDPPLTHLILSSAIFNALRKEQLLLLGSLTEWIIVGGETPSDEALQLATVNSHLKISQFYGPTETTVWCTVNHYENGQFNGKNIGKCLEFKTND